MFYIILHKYDPDIIHYADDMDHLKELLNRLHFDDLDDIEEYEIYKLNKAEAIVPKVKTEIML